MAHPPEVTNMALFCDFENVALGVRDAKYAQFDISKVLERLLLKGSIVVKKAYCDWERYKEFKATMHEASFELIEIPHVRQSGKNSADIRMVVDALDLCYTKSHVDTFVIISGDSDFSPLVSKLRENNKFVIGIGVKNSTSDLLIANCDEFIFYDDLVREKKKRRRSRTPRKARRRNGKPAAKAAAGEAKPPAKKGDEERRQEALDLIVETVEALIAERGDEEKIWGSMVKQALKRRKPGFNESYYGFRSFNGMLEEAQRRGSARARARREVRAATSSGCRRGTSERYARSRTDEPGPAGPFVACVSGDRRAFSSRATRSAHGAADTPSAGLTMIPGIHDLELFVISGLLLNVTPGADTLYIVGAQHGTGPARRNGGRVWVSAPAARCTRWPLPSGFQRSSRRPRRRSPSSNGSAPRTSSGWVSDCCATAPRGPLPTRVRRPRHRFPRSSRKGF